MKINVDRLEGKEPVCEAERGQHWYNCVAVLSISQRVEMGCLAFPIDDRRTSY